MEYDDKRMTFGDHLEELRARLIISIVAVAVAFIICWIFKKQLMDILTWPMLAAARKLGIEEKLQVLDPTEAFVTMLKVSAMAAFLVASPVVFLQMWKFVAAGLYANERRYVYIFAPLSVLLLLTGVVFAYFMVVKLGLEFLLRFGGDMEYLRQNLRLSSTIMFILWMTLIIGIVFELPLIMLFVAKIGIVTREDYSKYRRYAIFCAFPLGAILTPADPFTMLGVAIPVIVLYEFGIILCRLFVKPEPLAG